MLLWNVQKCVITILLCAGVASTHDHDGDLCHVGKHGKRAMTVVDQGLGLSK